MNEYSFSDLQVRALAKYVRKHEDMLDPCLDDFRTFLENILYNRMTIEEAERFFDDN